ncbi:ABC transporter ATP-binding protein [Thiorhodovibrio frisius]|uniref:ABC-type transport system involved in resistance to organic solvents, ATPase component n=1 Tax=Thiorhodovibrio frisius TaxID=631362 RepID=H8Z4Y9_9GAMM|nr:ATP-binding cassette domain-containing protein [Thiorhodovibrio frisius]EIC20396.1 ABC-type transport system involved in resistance to organic solvents, ATPase component [Thiorhodovibrio frisius]WPL21137.1 putative ABC transporter ATP-binding protein [Thiorhodovibrio frisius]
MSVAEPQKKQQAMVQVCDTKLAYGETVIQQDLNFVIRRGDIFIIMGSSGCGKSTLMHALTGLLRPAQGRILIQNQDLWHSNTQERTALMRRQGVMYQSGALWSAMTLRENVSLPLEIHTNLSAAQICAIADYKLALVGLAGFGDHYPSAISGGMRKRVGVARAIALDPELLFFDEPSAGLDPLSARRLDELLLQLRASLNTTMVVVTHELASIFTIADDAVFLDAERRTMLTTGNPRWLKEHSELAGVRAFLNRGET